MGASSFSHSKQGFKSFGPPQEVIRWREGLCLIRPAEIKPTLKLTRPLDIGGVLPATQPALSVQRG